MTDDPKAPEPANLPATQAPRKYEVVHSDIPIFDTAKFEHMARIAGALADSTLLPEHLRGVRENSTFTEYPLRVVQANALVIVNLAMKWKADPLAVAQAVSIVHGRPMFEGKLIAAVIENELGVKLRYTWSGDVGADDYTIRVWTDQDAARGFEPIEGSVGEWATNEKNGARKSIWRGRKTKLQLAYMGARTWCRLNAPGLILGLYAPDEFDDQDIIEHVPPPKITAGFANSPAAHGAPAPDATEPRPRPADAADALAHGIAGAKADENAGREAKSSTKGEKSKRTKAKAVDDSGADKPKLSSQLRAALEGAAESLRQANSGLQLCDMEQEPTFPINQPQDDEAAQEMLGRMNLAIDRANARLKKAPDMAQASGEDSEAAGEREPAASPPPPPPPPPAQAAPAPPTTDQILRNLADVMRPMKTWPELKTTFHGFTRNHEWREFLQADKAQAYRMVWGFASALNAERLARGETMEISPTADATAYRCAIEACDDHTIVETMWAEITESESFKAQKPATQNVVREATIARMELLKGAT